MKNNRLRWIALIGISILAFTAFLDVTIVNTANPFIKQTFHASILQLQWVTNVFSMVLTMTMVAVGRFADLFGRKKVFFIGVLLFGLAAFLAGFSPTIEVLIFFRALQGLGASVLFVASASLISEAFPSQEQGKAIGIYTGITGLGLAIGPFVGGLLVEWLDWRFVFWVNVPLVVFGLIFTSLSLKLPPHQKENAKIDWLGLIALICGLGSFIYGIIRAAELGFGFTTWAFLLSGIIFLTFFAISEKKAKEPLLELSFFKNKMIQLAVASCTLAGIASFVFMFFDPLYLNMERNFNPLKIGYFIAVIPIAQVMISFLFNHLLKKMGIKVLMVISIISAFLAIIAHFAVGKQTPALMLLIPFALLGVNWGLSNAGTISIVNQEVDQKKISIAIGSIFMMWNLGGCLVLTLSSAIFHVSDREFLFSFHSMVAFNAIFSFLILLWIALSFARK